MYVDTSAFLKLYVDEPDSAQCRAIVRASSEVSTARVTQIEVRRRLALEYEGSEAESVRAEFTRDWDELQIIEIDEVVCERAAVIAETTGLRSLDAIHLGAAEPLRGSVTFLTYDRRQADAARQLGWTVRGA